MSGCAGYIIVLFMLTIGLST